MQISNTLDIKITAALVAADRVVVQHADCSHLPWLDRDLTVWSNAQPKLQDSLNEALGIIAEARNRAPAQPLLDGTNKVLSALLRLYGVVVDFRPRLRLEEHAPGLADTLLAGLDDQARERIYARLSEDRIDWVPFENVLEANASELTVKDLQLGTEAVAIELGHAASLNLTSSKSVLLRGIAISVGAETIAERCCSIVLEKDRCERIELPEIPVRAYRTVKSKGGVVGLELSVGSAPCRIGPIELRLTVPELDGSPLALFVDLGSTNTKMLRIALPAGEAPSDWRAALQRQLEEAAHEKLPADAVNFPAPQPTPIFLSDRGLPPFDKEHLDKAPPEDLALWLASAIRALAQFAARERGSLLSHVFWSFPQTGGRDFAGLNRTIAKIAGAVVLDRIHVAAEHDCLRRRFAGVLEQLSASAQQREKDQREAEQKNKKLREENERAWERYRDKEKEYENKPFFVRWFKNKPSEPGSHHEQEVPRLEHWHRQFLELQVRPGLDEVLILDAGGYSLDAYARVRNSAKSQEFTRSFAAGGVRMTERVRETLAARRGLALEEVVWGEAENIKRETCVSDEHAGLSADCRKLTAEIYSPALREVAEWIRDHTRSRGLPLILTGGAMANCFLHELLVAVLKEHGLSSASTTTVELVGLIRLPTADQSRHALFSAVACAFDPKTDPRLDYDVLGGLVQYAASTEESGG
jgi:hypothetical protein